MGSPRGNPALEQPLVALRRKSGTKHGCAALCKRATCLHQLFAALNAGFFHGLCTASIGWGRAGSPGGWRRRARRSMTLGSYCSEQDCIRIHPVLRESWVPHFVVELVVFHEMLHGYLGVEVSAGRRRIHPPDFRAIEQSHPRYAQALAWEEANLPRLLAWRP